MPVAWSPNILLRLSHISLIPAVEPLISHTILLDWLPAQHSWLFQFLKRFPTNQIHSLQNEKQKTKDFHSVQCLSYFLQQFTTNLL